MYRLSVMLLPLLLTLIPSWSSADTGKLQTEVIHLQHRTAAAMLPVLQPHLPGQATLSQQGTQLIITAQQEDIERLVQLAKQLDQPLQTWRVYFARGDIDLAMQQQQQQSVRRYSTRQLALTQLQLREEAPAAFEQGFWVPINVRSVSGGLETSYRWLSGGMWVLARSQGEQVVLEFSARQIESETHRGGNPSLDFSAAKQQSQLLLQPGQWLTLGSESRLSVSTPSTSRRYSTGQRDEFYSVCLESDKAPFCPR
ncbi:MAG: hypothetical protein IBX50_04725 [Marinospirillum sp.]|uniref:secretin N-terminal domain-containing protein n=1 Tax=Marinospirillum sp. TaxID=2183934 RepID=UPI0019ED32B3|nr:secretin N-terminal domain-containing protein [Marinospirillum sp.]MBE0506012.1 hypothetical protein [Marinospirillum sp.]